MAANTIPSTVSGEDYIASLARYIRSHSEQLSSASSPLKGAGHQDARASWASMLYLSNQAPKPVTLTLDLYHLYYVLLKIQEAGFADVGDLDEPLRFDHHRRPALPAASLARQSDNSDTLSIKTSFSTISKGLSSIGSGWWGASSSNTPSDAATALERDLKLIYTAFTLLPSLKLVRQDAKGKGKAIEGFDFPDLPGDRMLPLKAFKSLERLELEGLDARVLLFSGEWQNIVNLRVSDCGIEAISELLSACRRKKDEDLEWGVRLRILDLECNDITTIDSEEIAGLERVLSLSLRRNLLVSVPTALASMTSLRALDLSGNMIDSLLAVYSSLPGLQVLNLRGNRISSLCGIERLLSIEKLDVRDNEIYDATEVARLVTLPHLTDLWIGEGNPFLDDATSHRGHGWRLKFYDSFLRVPEKAGRRSLSDLPRLDGAHPSWNEQRHLSQVHKHHDTKSEQTETTRDVATWPRNGQGHLRTATNASVDVPVKTLRSRRSRNFTENTAHAARTTSPPPPLPAHGKQDGLNSGQAPGGDTQSSDASVALVKSAPVKAVKKRHRRVVDLDTNKSASASDSNHTTSREHHRTQSHPVDSVSLDVSNSEVPTSRQLQHKTLPKQDRPQKKNSRALSENTFDNPDLHKIDSGSDAEEFRKKMEKLREEVGARNWLSVYASTVHSRQADVVD